jgi:hypothetical protein
MEPLEAITPPATIGATANIFIRQLYWNPSANESGLTLSAFETNTSPLVTVSPLSLMVYTTRDTVGSSSRYNYSACYCGPTCIYGQTSGENCHTTCYGSTAACGLP